MREACKLPVYDSASRGVLIAAWALVDSDLLPMLMQYRWTLDDDGYVQRRAGGRRIRLHSVVIGALAPSLMADHVSRDKLDNRRQNLRAVTSAQNAQNVGPQRRNASGIRGAHWDRTCGRWKAEVVLAGRKHALGYFDRAEDAGAAARHWRGLHMSHSGDTAA